MKFKEIFKNYSIIIVIAIFGTTGLIIQYFQLSGIYILILGILGFIFIAIREVIEKHSTKSKEDKEKIEKDLTDEKLNVIEDKITIKNTELEYKKRLMSEFLRYGLVKEDDIIDNLNQEPFVIIYHFNKKLPKSIEQFSHEKDKILVSILNKLGFVPVGRYHGSYFFHVISSNSLPKPLDDIPHLEAYIRKKLKIIWKKMWREMEEKNKKLYKKYKDEKDERTNLSYFLGKIFPSNLSIGYLNFHTFDDKFLTYYSRFTNLKKIKINTQKLKDLVSLASISFFVNSIEPKDRKVILQNEKKIKKNFGIKNLLDYESIKKEQWKKELNEIFPNKPEKTIIHAKIISDTIKRFIPVIKEYL